MHTFIVFNVVYTPTLKCFPYVSLTTFSVYTPLLSPIEVYKYRLFFGDEVFRVFCVTSYFT